MANLSKTTQDHEEIRRWAEERGGKPSHVKSTGSKSDVGILRIDFPGYSGAGSLEEISWDDWFEKFDEQGLALLYEEETAGGQKSNFNKIVSAATAAENESRPNKKSSTKKTGAKKTVKNAAKKAPAKAAKKTAAKKTAAKKAVVKKVAAKKAAKKAPAKKVAAKKAAKKAPAKKVAAKKATAKKAAVKKPAKKAVASKKRR